MTTLNRVVTPGMEKKTRNPDVITGQLARLFVHLHASFTPPYTEIYLNGKVLPPTTLGVKNFFLEKPFETYVIG